MYAVVQVVGALLILAPFVLTLLGLLSQQGWPYLISNAAGSGLLTASAIASTQWGFILLEGTWFVASFYSIVRKSTGSALRTQ